MKRSWKKKASVWTMAAAMTVSYIPQYVSAEETTQSGTVIETQSDPLAEMQTETLMQETPMETTSQPQTLSENETLAETTSQTQVLSENTTPESIPETTTQATSEGIPETSTQAPTESVPETSAQPSETPSESIQES